MQIPEEVLYYTKLARARFMLHPHARKKRQLRMISETVAGNVEWLEMLGFTSKKKQCHVFWRAQLILLT